MSIVYDFPAINSRLRGDDWWEPVKCEAPGGGSGGEPALAGPREDGVLEGCVFREARENIYGGGAPACVHAFSDYDFRCKWCGSPEPTIMGPIPVGGSCGMTTATEMRLKIQAQKLKWQALAAEIASLPVSPHQQQFLDFWLRRDSD